MIGIGELSIIVLLVVMFALAIGGVYGILRHEVRRGTGQEVRDAAQRYERGVGDAPAPTGIRGSAADQNR